jgi:hypothetical protein
MGSVFTRVSNLSEQDLSKEAVQGRISAAGIKQSKCELVAGDVCETTLTYKQDRPGARISVLYLDMDLYKPTKAALDNLWDMVVPGGIVVFDEHAYHAWTETKAVEEFCVEKWQYVYHTNVSAPTAFLMKLAVLLIGNIRTWDYCKESFLKTFQRYNPDVYLVTENVRYNHHPYVQGSIGDSSDELIDKDTIEELFKNINLIDYCINDVEPAILKLRDPIFFPYNLSLKQFEKLITCTSLLRQSYDVIIKTRCDLMYTDLIHNCLNFNSSDILVDSGNVYPNDCIIACNGDNMVNLSKSIFQEIFTPRFNDSHVNAPHNLLLNAARSLSLNFKAERIMQCVVRKGNNIRYY